MQAECLHNVMAHIWPAWMHVYKQALREGGTVGKDMH